jgi:hypothetical protein
MALRPTRRRFKHGKLAEEERSGSRYFDRMWKRSTQARGAVSNHQRIGNGITPRPVRMHRHRGPNRSTRSHRAIPLNPVSSWRVNPPVHGMFVDQAEQERQNVPARVR